ncbi:MAG: TVP38/TMEM64 family protein, partial [Desulfobacterales bacterium]|nr:TVP38/TMEM64 family protein [Desulfobacterales bacterium]
MEEAIRRPQENRKKVVIKASILVTFIIVAIGLVRFTPVKSYLTPETLGRFLDTAGIWASLVFMLVYALGVCLFIPGTVLTGLGAAIFGPYWGFLY